MTTGLLKHWGRRTSVTNETSVPKGMDSKVGVYCRHRDSHRLGPFEGAQRLDLAELKYAHSRAIFARMRYLHARHVRCCAIFGTGVVLLSNLKNGCRVESFCRKSFTATPRDQQNSVKGGNPAVSSGTKSEIYTKAHANRLDATAYRSLTTRSCGMVPHSV